MLFTSCIGKPVGLSFPYIYMFQLAFINQYFEYQLCSPESFMDHTLALCYCEGVPVYFFQVFYHSFPIFDAFRLPVCFSILFV